MPVLAITSVLLLVVGFGVQAAARGSLAEQDATLAALRRQRSADAARTVLPGELPRPAVNVAALRVRLAAVTAADRDVDASVKKWVESDTKLSTVWDALERCMYRVDQYDRLAGRFSAAELGDLPVTIDTSAAASDCGRAAITRYAAGSSL